MQGQLASSLGAVDHLAGSFDLIAATGLLVGSLLSDTLFFLKVFIFQSAPSYSGSSRLVSFFIKN